VHFGPWPVVGQGREAVSSSSADSSRITGSAVRASRSSTVRASRGEQPVAQGVRVPFDDAFLGEGLEGPRDLALLPGAETNGFVVTEDICARRKVYIGHAAVKPRIAVLDPELTVGLPARITAATGVEIWRRRSELMLGAHLAGRALTLSGLGLVHGIGHALTAHTGTPRGVALAAVLEEVVRFSAAAAAEAEVAGLLHPVH